MKKIVVGIIVIILSIMVFLLLSNNKLTILEKYETLGFHEINEDGFKGYINNISNNEKEIKLYKNNKCYYKDIFTEEVKNVKVDNYNDCTEAGKTTSNKCYKVAIENDSAILTGFDYNCSKNAILPDVVTVSGVEYKLENIKEIEQDNEEVIQSIFLGVEKIRLPIHLNNIPNKMYSDNLISQIRIPDSVTYIGEQAFYSLMGGNLKNVYLGKNVKEIKNLAFDSNKLECIKLNDNLKIIRNLAFSNNTLKEVEFNDGLEEIYYRAFYKNNIEEINLPSSIKILGVSPITEIFDKNVLTIKIDKAKDELLDSPWGAVNAKIIWKN